MEKETFKKNLYFMTIVLVMLISTIFNFVLFLIQEKNVDQEKLFEDSTKSVVEVKAETESIGESFGSGVFVLKDGTLITNAHVVTYKKLGQSIAFENIWIRFAYENDYRAVTLVKFDINKDLAVLKLEDTNCGYKSIKFANFSKTKVGQDVYAIGNLNNVGISLTKGSISNKKLNVEYNGVSREVVQCDITIAEGNSGGALINSNGELVGITTFRLKDSSNNVIYGIAYCVPANIVLEYIK